MVLKKLTFVQIFGVFMKKNFIFLLLLGNALMVSAQSIKEIRDKEIVLNRVDSLISQIDECRAFLDDQNVVEACKKINHIFQILPDHLMAIGTKLDMFDSKNIKMEAETRLILIDIHKRKNICQIGEDGENLDITETNEKLKSIRKILLKQKKRLNKSNMGYNNFYHYYYEF